MSKSILPGYPGDAFFPRLILIFSIFWTSILLIQNLVKNFLLFKSVEDKETDIEIYFKDIAFLFFISIIYILFLDFIGFEILTFSFLFVLLVNRLDLNLGKSIIYSSLLSFISMIIFWFVFIIFLKIPFSLKFLPFLLY
jgi:putative tricarboxylic transport membrane protein